MKRLDRSVPRVVLAMVLAAVITSGCSSSWPRVTSVSDARFNSWAPPASIDVLPVDLEVWTSKEIKDNPDELRQKAESSIIGAATEQLFQRGYAVGAVLDWQGQFVGASGQLTYAYAPIELLDTIDALSSFGTAIGVTREMPAPYLPVRLGERTGSEATLYIGGWGFAGKRTASTGETIAKGVLIAVAIVGVVAILAILAKSDSGGKILDGVGKGVGTAAKVATSAGRVALRTAARAGNVVVEVARAGAQNLDVAPGVHVDLTVADVGRSGDQVVAAAPQQGDVFGRTETHLNLVPGRPEWSQQADAKHSGSSAMYLEMTLVDNRTGLVRWHAHQRFPANPRNPGNITRAVKAMLASMPAR
jgi:hypothetical protein